MFLIIIPISHLSNFKKKKMKNLHRVSQRLHRGSQRFLITFFFHYAFAPLSRYAFFNQNPETALNYLQKRTLLFTFHELIYNIDLDYY